MILEWDCDYYRRKDLILVTGNDEEAIEDIESFKKLLMAVLLFGAFKEVHH